MVGQGNGWQLSGLLEFILLMICLKLACLEPGIYPVAQEKSNAG